jgi:hypothetical protein
MIDAIDNTVPGEVFFLQAPTGGFDISTKSSKHGAGFPIDKIRSNGRRIFYTQNGELIAATARSDTTADIEWSINLAAQGITGAVFGLDCDGEIVAVTDGAAGTNGLLVVNESTGATIYTSVLPAYQVACASTSSEQAVYTFGTSTTDTQIYRWVTGGVLAFWFATGLNPASLLYYGAHSLYATVDGVAFLEQFKHLTGSHAGELFIAQRVISYSGVSTSVLGTFYNPDPWGGTLYQFSQGTEGLNVMQALADPLALTKLRPFVNFGSSYTGNAFPANLTTTEASGIDDKYFWFQDVDYINAMTLQASVSFQFEKAGADATGMDSDAYHCWTNCGPVAVGNDTITCIRVLRQPGFWLRTNGRPEEYGDHAVVTPITSAEDA